MNSPLSSGRSGYVSGTALHILNSEKKYYIIVAATSWLSGGTGQIFYLPSFAPDPATWEAKAID